MVFDPAQAKYHVIETVVARLVQSEHVEPVAERHVNDVVFRVLRAVPVRMFSDVAVFKGSSVYEHKHRGILSVRRRYYIECHRRLGEIPVRDVLIVPEFAVVEPVAALRLIVISPVLKAVYRASRRVELVPLRVRLRKLKTLRYRVRNAAEYSDTLLFFTGHFTESGLDSYSFH